jgi:hypothetical protein
LPALVGKLDIDLGEGTGQLLLLPRRSGFAGTQADDDVLDLERLTWTDRHVANDAVAFVKDAKNRDTLRHRGDPGLRALRLAGRRSGRGVRPGFRLVGCVIAIAAAGGERDHQDCQPRGTHAQSGVQG